MTNPEPPDQSPTFHFQSVGIKASAQVRDGKFVVLAGSEARAQVVDSYERNVPSGYRAHRSRLIAEGILQPDEVTGELQFTHDEEFRGSTEAGCVVAGGMSNGIRDWFIRMPDGSKHTHGDWLKSTSMVLPIELTMPNTVVFAALWKPFFGELAQRLLDFEDRQSELTDILREAGVHIQHDEGQPLSVMDPFSFFSLILKHQSESRVAEILTRIKTRLNLTENVPDDLSGVPWSNPMNAWYFAYRSKRQPEDLPTLWTLARQAVAGQLEAETFARALAIRKVAPPKLTTGLFWLNPEAFLVLNGVTVPYLERHAVSGAGRVQTLAEYGAVLTKASDLAPEFSAVSYLAWQASQTGKSVAKLDRDAFPFSSFVEEAEQYATDTPKGNMLLDRRYGQLLLSLIQEEDFEHLKPARSPYSGKTQLAVKLGLGFGPKAESQPFARAMLFPQDSYGDYVTYRAGLTLEVGLPDGKGDEARNALQNAELRETLLMALLDSTALPQSPLFTLRTRWF